MKLLLTRQPVATGYPSRVGCLTSPGDLERIGDQATDIAEVALTLPRPELDDELSAHLREMGDRAYVVPQRHRGVRKSRDAELLACATIERCMVDALFEV